MTTTRLPMISAVQFPIIRAAARGIALPKPVQRRDLNLETKGILAEKRNPKFKDR